MEDTINFIDGKVQIIFQKGEHPMTYRDALWFTETEYSAVTTEHLDQVKQQRYDNWLAIVNAVETPAETPVELPAP
jgi:hypothetical protein